MPPVYTRFRITHAAAFGNAARKVRGDLLDAAGGLGARHLKVVGDMRGTAWPLEAMAENFAALCTQAEDVGIKVGIEIMPWCNLNTIEKALEVTRLAGAGNGGVFLDIWHLVRGGVDFANISMIEASELVSVELEDAAAEPVGTLWNDAINNRLPCGDGGLDIGGFVEQLRRIGYHGPVGSEIFSEKQRKLPLEEAARRTYEAARRFVP